MRILDLALGMLVRTGVSQPSTPYISRRMGVLHAALDYRIRLILPNRASKYLGRLLRSVAVSDACPNSVDAWGLSIASCMHFGRADQKREKIVLGQL